MRPNLNYSIPPGATTKSVLKYFKIVMLSVSKIYSTENPYTHCDNVDNVQSVLSIMYVKVYFLVLITS